MKSTLEEIQKKFDTHVDVYSNEETGQTSAMDSLPVLQMVADTAARTNPQAKTMCDIGCGGGNFSIKLLQQLPHLSCTLVDVSRPMLERAKERIGAKGGAVECMMHSPIQTAELKSSAYDIIVAGAVLHHLRTREDWAKVFIKIHDALTEDGTFFYWDLIKHEREELQTVQQERYKQYLIHGKDEAFQRKVFEDIEREDTPETVPYILTQLIKTGFHQVDVMHKNGMFAALMGKK